MTRVAAVVLAGGSGARMGIDANKVHLSVGGTPILARSLRTLERCAAVAAIVVVNRPADDALTDESIRAAGANKVVAVVPGGATRTGSELAGLAAVAGVARVARVDDGEAPFDLVLVHDAARPFVTLDLLDVLIAAADEDGGAVPGLPLDDRVYESHDGVVTLLDGRDLRRVQTPQVFRTAALLAAYRDAQAADFEGFDTAQTVERFGPTLLVRVVAGDPRNIKVTTTADLAVAEELAVAFDDGRWRT